MAFKVIKQNIMSENDSVADEIREKLEDTKTLMINIIASPGAGKTLFLEKAGPVLKKSGIKLTVITGDCYTTKDAQRLDAVGLDVIQINTEGACHINAEIVKKALKKIDLKKQDLIIIENVGNLVCPADFDLGEDEKIAFHSTTEGHDKPIKYPMLAKTSRLAIINKIDLMDVLDFDLTYAEESIYKINPSITLLKVSSKTGEGIDSFVEWIKEKIKIKESKK